MRLCSSSTSIIEDCDCSTHSNILTTCAAGALQILEFCKSRRSGWCDPPMPVSFLSEDQTNRFGRFTGEPTPEQLARFFHLDDADKQVVALRRGDHHRLGFAIQLGTVRFLGTFLEAPQEAPLGVVANVAHQWSIGDPSCYAQYCIGEQRWEHAAEIRKRYGYTDFSEWPVQFRLNRWL